MTNKSSTPQPQTPTGFTPKEAAHQLGITGKALRRAIRKGKLEAVKVSGRWYIDPKVLNAYKEAREKASEEADSAE